jgi:uncharacterized protein (TIGR03437 family)
MTTIIRVVATMIFAVLVTVSAFAQLQPQLYVSSSAMNFTYQMGSSFPSPQVLTITSNVPTMYISSISIVTDMACGWLSTNQGYSFSGNTPLTLSISEHPSSGGMCGLQPGTYYGSINIYGSYNNYGCCSSMVNVTLTVLAPVPTPQYADTAYFSYKVGGAIPAIWTEGISASQAGSVATGITTRVNQPWLLASLSSTSTPSVLSIRVNPVNMAVGNYTGIVDVVNSVSDLQFFVNLTITAPIQLTASPSSLSFSAVQGGSNPPSQTFQVTASVGNAAVGQNAVDMPNVSWLTTDYFGVGNTPFTMRVYINISNLSPGTYTTTLRYTSLLDNTAVSIPVTLTVTAPPPVLRTSTNQLQFQYLAGSNTTPGTQAIQVTSSGTALTASVSLSVPWLTANPLNGSTPFTVNVGVNPTGLAAGTYNGQATVNTNSSTQTIGVTLVVAPDLRPVLTSVVNAASFKSAIGPGTWISLMGSNLAPNTWQTSVPLPTSFYGVSAELQGVGGVYNLLIEYVSPTQINAFVPQDLPVSFFGTSCSVAVTVPTGATSFATTCQGLSPALFFYGSGTGQYSSATHLDGSVIGVIPGTRPAQNGEIITLWGTGFGQTAPAVSDVNSVFAPQALANSVAVYVGGQSVQVLWAGMVGTGLDQFNIQLPDNLTSGDVPISIKIGGTETERVVLPVR